MLVRLHDELHIVHGDISRKNIVFSRARGGVVLLDFGNAFFATEEVCGPCGTHLSSSNARGERITTADDMFACGDMLDDVCSFRVGYFAFGCFLCLPTSVTRRFISADDDVVAHLEITIGLEDHDDHIQMSHW